MSVRQYGALLLALFVLAVAACLVIVALPDDLDDGTVVTTDEAP